MHPIYCDLPGKTLDIEFFSTAKTYELERMLGNFLFVKEAFLLNCWRTLSSFYENIKIGCCFTKLDALRASPRVSKIHS